MRSLLVFLFGVSVASAQTTEAWTWKNPYPQANDLAFVTTLPNGTLFAGGNGGMLLRSTDNGNSWTARPYPGGLRVLYSAHFPSNSLGFIGGDDRFGGGAVVRTTDGGNTWSLLSTNSFAAPLGIRFFSDTLGLVAGTGGTILRTTNGGSSWTAGATNTFDDMYDVAFRSSTVAFAASKNGRIYSSGDGGQTWTKTQFQTNTTFRSVAVSSNSRVVVVGDSGWVMFLSPSPLASWTRIAVPTTESFFAVHWLSGSKAVGVGSSGIELYSNDIGATWNVRSTGLDGTLSSVAGSDSTVVIAIGTGGATLVSADTAVTWTQIDRGDTPQLTSVSASSGARAIAVGANGFAYWRDNALTSWNPVAGAFAVRMNTAVLTSDTTGLAAGSNGAVYRTSTGGESWDSLTSGVSATFNGSVTQNGTTLFVGAGGTILRTTDNGTSWSHPSSGVSTTLRSVDDAGAGIFWVVGDGPTVLRSTDDGATWQPETVNVTASLRAVCFGDSLTGIIGGTPLDAGLPPTILRTTDGGTSWIQEYVQVPHSYDPFAFFTIQDIANRSATEYLASTIEGILFRSTNGGDTWSELRVGTSYDIRGIVWMHDRWIAAGDHGMILESPRDTTVVKVAIAMTTATPGPAILLEVYPNPFNPEATVRFTPPADGAVRVTLHNLLGQEVATLFSGNVRAGLEYRVSVDGSSLSSGTYIVRVVQHQSVRSERVLLVR